MYPICDAVSAVPGPFGGRLPAAGDDIFCDIQNVRFLPTPCIFFIIIALFRNVYLSEQRFDDDCIEAPFNVSRQVDSPLFRFLLCRHQNLQRPESQEEIFRVEGDEFLF